MGDLRHEYASRALAFGESLTMIDKVPGYTQVQTTARYAHLARDSIQTAATRILETIRDVCAQLVADDGLRFDTENILAEPFGEDRTHGAFRTRTSA